MYIRYTIQVETLVPIILVIINHISIIFYVQFMQQIRFINN